MSEYIKDSLAFAVSVILFITIAMISGFAGLAIGFFIGGKWLAIPGAIVVEIVVLSFVLPNP